MIKNKQQANTRMDRMKKIKWKNILVVIVVIVAIWGGSKGLVALVSAGWNMSDESVQADKLDSVQFAESEFSDVASEPGSEFALADDWDDNDVMKTIHQMSHQKVRADQKWGAVEITQERLNTLSDIIETQKDELDGYATYRSILDKWMKGDFSTAHIDHNTIWDMQGGTVGKAVGIADEEEEQKWIDRHFK